MIVKTFMNIKLLLLVHVTLESQCCQIVIHDFGVNSHVDDVEVMHNQSCPLVDKMYSGCTANSLNSHKESLTIEPKTLISENPNDSSVQYLRQRMGMLIDIQAKLIDVRVHTEIM